MRLDIYNNRDVSDIPLIGNPQITYFKSVYRKHTHFAIERHRVGCNASNVLNRIDHFGDLIKSIDLEINITGNTITGDSDSMTNLGTALIENIKLHVGSEEIEKISGSYIEMYMELKNPRGLQTFNIIDTPLSSPTKFVCKQGTMEQILSLSGGVFKAVAATAPGSIDIVLPIPFSFCRDIGYAFPIFLFHLDRPLSISFNTNSILNDTAIFEYNFIINYILLTENEKMRFRTSKNEYLHERIYEQKITLNSNVNYISIDPVGNIKSIMWGKTTAIDYKYNIEVNKYKLFNQDKSYHYFTRKTISDAGYPGGSSSIITTAFTADDATDTITTTISPHNLSINDTVVLTTTGTLPDGLELATTYYIHTTPLTANTFKLSGSAGGSIINIIDAGSGDHTLTSTTDVIHDDKIGFYSFALKDYSKEDPLAPTGSISSSANKIYFIVNNYMAQFDEEITLYIKAYNIINISDGYFKLKYQH